ncbi:MAG: ESX secretion-associated protein EspG [Thermocrispum sp.]
MVISTTIERCALGEVPVILRRGDPWLPPEAVAELAAAVDAELAADGLLIGGRLREDFEDALVTAARPAEALSGVVDHRQLGAYQLHLARLGRDAVLLDRTGNDVEIIPAEADRLARSFAQRLPAHFDGVGRSYAFPESEAPWNARAGYTRDGRRARHDARLAAELFTQPRTGGAQIHATGAGGTGRHPLNILDLADLGRWSITKDGDPAEPHVTIAPVTGQQLAAQLDALLRAVAG